MFGKSAPYNLDKALLLFTQPRTNCIKIFPNAFDYFSEEDLEVIRIQQIFLIYSFEIILS